MAFFLGLAPGAIAQPAEGFADLAERLSPAVVNISTAQRLSNEDTGPTFDPDSPLDRFNDLLGERPRIANSLGSGFIIDPEGVVVTNNHVIDGADEIEVILADGRILPARLIGRDPETDLAVLRIPADTPLPAVAFGPSDSARVGDWVVAIGNPFGLGGSLAAGVVSAQGRDIGGRYDDYIQTDVAINRGNSGGPLFNLEGEVIGVNTAIFSPTGASVGISFSIPAHVAEPVIAQLIEFGETRRGWLGLNVHPVDADLAEALGLERPQGAVVSRIDPDGPAAAAGFEPGDVILAVDDEPVDDDRRLSRTIAETQPGATITVQALRAGEPITLEATIERLAESGAAAAAVEAGAPADPLGEGAGPLLGLTLEPLTDQSRRQYRVHPAAEGALVTGVDPTSNAAGKIRPGDVLAAVEWAPVAGPAQARRLVEEALAEDSGPVLLSLNRAGQYVLRGLRP